MFKRRSTLEESREAEAAIQKFFAGNLDATNVMCQAALAEQGIEISPSFIAKVRNELLKLDGKEFCGIGLLCTPVVNQHSRTAIAFIDD